MWICPRCKAGNPDDCHCPKTPKEPVNLLGVPRAGAPLTVADLEEINRLRGEHDKWLRYAGMANIKVKLYCDSDEWYGCDESFRCGTEEPQLDAAIRAYFTERAAAIRAELLERFNVQLAD